MQKTACSVNWPRTGDYNFQRLAFILLFIYYLLIWNRAAHKEIVRDAEKHIHTTILCLPWQNVEFLFVVRKWSRCRSHTHVWPRASRGFAFAMASLFSLLISSIHRFVFVDFFRLSLCVFCNASAAAQLHSNIQQIKTQTAHSTQCGKKP